MLLRVSRTELRAEGGVTRRRRRKRSSDALFYSVPPPPWRSQETVLDFSKLCALCDSCTRRRDAHGG